jgi:hypothetical protein
VDADLAVWAGLFRTRGPAGGGVSRGGEDRLDLLVGAVADRLHLGAHRAAIALRAAGSLEERLLLLDLLGDERLDLLDLLRGQAQPGGEELEPPGLDLFRVPHAAGRLRGQLGNDHERAEEEDGHGQEMTKARRRAVRCGAGHRVPPCVRMMRGGKPPVRLQRRTPRVQTR